MTEVWPMLNPETTDRLRSLKRHIQANGTCVDVNAAMIELIDALVGDEIEPIDGRPICKNCGLRIYFDNTGDPLRNCWRHHGSNFEECFGTFDSATNSKIRKAEP